MPASARRLSTRARPPRACDGAAGNHGSTYFHTSSGTSSNLASMASKDHASTRTANFRQVPGGALSTLGKIHLFANGTWQKLYVRQQPDSLSATAEGLGFGVRVEVGPVHLAAGGHTGKGLGLTFALEPSDSTYSD